MALSILALCLNQYSGHLTDVQGMKINWWSWIFSQQATVCFSVPLEWVSPAGSPLRRASAKHSEQTQGATCLLSLTPSPCLLLDLGTLTAIPWLNHMDKDRNNIKLGNFSATSMFLCLLLMSSYTLIPKWHLKSHILYWICICSCVCLSDSESKGSFTCRSLKLWHWPSKHPIHTVLHGYREQHQSEMSQILLLILELVKGYS